MLFLILPLLIGALAAARIDAALPRLRNAATTMVVLGTAAVLIAGVSGNLGFFYGGAMSIWIGVVIVAVYFVGVYRQGRAIG